MGPEFQFDFIDAPYPANPAPGIDLFYDPPYYVWYREPDATSIKAAVNWLYDYLKQREPYDAVMGFSQGCSLISSLLLYHAHERPNDPLPFKGAIFICGGFPLTILPDMGFEVSEEAHQISNNTGKLLKQTASSISSLAEEMRLADPKAPRVGLWDDTSRLEHDPEEGFPMDRSNVFGLDYTVFPKNFKIKIPTVHIVGKKDPRYPSGVQVAHFCDEGVYGSNRRTYSHPGGHDIPRTAAVSENIAGLVRWLEKIVMN